ncbi:MAG TPA: HIT domain-containing protein [Balneolales bacterium]|nr:HIT domain-containing protein [Balneolales bacterium]
MNVKFRNPNAHLTAKERKYPSYPTKKLYRMGRIKGRVLDFGCGYGADVKFLKTQSFDIVGYDPVYAPDYPDGKFDTIICNYVLNVLLPVEQASVLMQISELLKPGGHTYFTVRRDVRYEGFRTHRKYHKKTYQCNVKLPWESIFQNEFCEIYNYQLYSITSKLNVHTECPFCVLNDDHELLTESATAFAILDKFPVNEGHALIIPKRHISSYFDLTDREQSALWLMVNRVKKLLEKQYSPDGFNVGINIGEDAGQTVPHVHIHLIPRYNGDIEDPTGGVRFVIPDKANYMKRNPTN